MASSNSVFPVDVSALNPIKIDKLRHYNICFFFLFFLFCFFFSEAKIENFIGKMIFLIFSHCGYTLEPTH